MFLMPLIQTVQNRSQNNTAPYFCSILFATHVVPSFLLKSAVAKGGGGIKWFLLLLLLLCEQE
jgi:hypothetical protein